MMQLQDFFFRLIRARRFDSPCANKWAIKITSEFEKLAGVVLPIWFAHSKARRWQQAQHTEQAQQERQDQHTEQARQGRQSDVVVSLTSFPLRLPRLWLVIECLLRQTVAPERIVLYLSRLQVPDESHLPDSLRRYIGHGLEVRIMDDDLRSHKKYWYAVTDFPDRDILIVDDDVIYPSYLLEHLLRCKAQRPHTVVAGNFHRIMHAPDGSLLSYMRWPDNIKGGERGDDIFLIGNGGTLYPAGSLRDANLPIDDIRRLCPMADDVWLNAIIRRNGYRVAAAWDNALRVPGWLYDTNETLAATNANTSNGECQNDVQIEAVRQYMQEVYGTQVF